MKKNRPAQINGMPALSSRPLNDRGFTYLMALMIIMVMGIMLGMVGQSWKTIMQREREQELIFRGTQIIEAIGRWRKPKPGGHVVTPLRDLKDLLQDPRTLTTTRYLRRLYTDPMTGKEWKVISDPNLGITGVASTSDARPLKVGGFPEGFESLEKKEKYSDWQFVYTMLDKKPATPPPPAGIPGLPPGMVRPPLGDNVRPSFQTK